METVPIELTINVPKPLYDAGAVELFAKAFGWTEQIEKIDDQGNVTLVQNDQSAFEVGQKQLELYMYEHAKNQYINEQANKAAAEFQALVG